MRMETKTHVRIIVNGEATDTAARTLAELIASLGFAEGSRRHGAQRRLRAPQRACRDLPGRGRQDRDRGTPPGRLNPGRTVRAARERMDLQDRPLRRRRIRRRSEPIFWVALSVAALLHVGLIFEIGRASPRIMGEQNGAPEALSVEMVDASQLRSKSTIPPRAESGSAPPATAMPPPPPTPAEPSTAPSTPEVVAAIPPEQEKKPTEKATEQPVDKQAPEVAAPPSPPRKPSEAARKPREKSAPEQKQSSLQLDLPQNFSASPGSGWSTGATRPPDITRSGENDEFGRGVIRALRRTMPEPRGETGRVTVRLLLSDTGNLAELQLIRGATDPILTQSVVFAVRQSSFPIPPVGATVSDRSFLVTYVYN